MPDFLVGSAQTYTTIQAAVDAVAALGDLAGLGDHNIIIDDGFVHSGALDLTATQAKTDGKLFIKAVEDGTYTLNMTSGLRPNGYTTIQDFIGDTAVGYADTYWWLDDNSVENYVKNFVLNNSAGYSGNAFKGSASFRAQYIENGIIEGFTQSDFSRAVNVFSSAKNLTIYNCSIGVQATGTVTDCVAVCDNVCFSSNTTISYCASNDGTATGTGSIINIIDTDEFTDPANDDFTLKVGSQLIGAGSTGGDIGRIYAVQGPAIDTVSGDDEVAKGEQSITVALLNATGLTGITSANIAGVPLTSISYSPGAAFFTCNVPKSVVAGTGVTFTAFYTDSGGSGSFTKAVNVVGPSIVNIDGDNTVSVGQDGCVITLSDPQSITSITGITIGTQALENIVYTAGEATITADVPDAATLQTNETLTVNYVE